jgi:hypothetical protein
MNNNGAEEYIYRIQLKNNHARTPDEWERMRDLINDKKEKSQG